MLRRRIEQGVARLHLDSPAGQRRVGMIAMGIATVVALALCTYVTRGRGFALDEWNLMVVRREWSFESFFAPANAHFVFFPTLLSKILFSTVGAGSYVPYKVVNLAFQAGMAWLMFIYAARRIGYLAALIPAVLLLFLGSGWEVLINGAALDNQISITAGLGALLCLDRGSRRGDIAAMVLLIVTVASHALGLAFAAGALVEIALMPAPRKRIWVPLIPIALYSIWLVWAQKYGDTLISGYSVGSLPSGVFDQLAAALAALTGLFRQPNSLDVGAVISTLRADRTGPLVFVLIAAIVARLRIGPRPSPRLWAAVTILAAYLVLVGLGLSDNRPPGASRYAFMASVLVLLALVQMTEGLTISRTWAGVAAAIAALALVPNIAQLHTAGDFFRIESNDDRAELAVLELGRGTVDPHTLLETNITSFLPHRDIFFDAEAYFSTVDDFGSPAFSEPELLAAPERYREVADQTDAQILGLTFAPPTGPEPTSCRRISPRADGTFGELRYSGGETLVLRPSPGAQVQLAMRRFADAQTVSTAPTSAPAAFSIRADRSPRPWRFSIFSSAPVTVCGS